MKKAILTIAIAVMGFTATFAQDSTKRVRPNMPKQTPELRAEKATAMLDKNLSLTADQKTKIYQINLDRAKKMETLRSAAKDDRKGRGQEFKADMDASNKQLEAVLTPDQKTKYEALKSEMKGKMRDGARKGMGRDHNDKKPVVSNPPTQG